MSGYKTVKNYARELRKNQTPAEQIMWRALRNRNFHGKKFNRQFIIQHGGFIGKLSYFIADFHCHEHKLIIEIDGKIHLQQIEYDKIREGILIGMGYQILRFTNEAVHAKLGEVLDIIRRTLGIRIIDENDENVKTFNIIKY